MEENITPNASDNVNNKENDLRKERPKTLNLETINGENDEDTSDSNRSIRQSTTTCQLLKCSRDENKLKREMPKHVAPQKKLFQMEITLTYVSETMYIFFSLGYRKTKENSSSQEDLSSRNGADLDLER